MSARKRSDLIVSVLSVVLLLGAQACSSPPDRVAFNTIDGATTAVQTSMRVFNDFYQSGKATEAQRTQVLDAYRKFQAAANAAAVMSSDLGTKTPLPRTVADAAAQLLALINAFTGGP